MNDSFLGLKHILKEKQKNFNIFQYILFLALILLIGVLSLCSDKFLTTQNIISILRQVSVQSIMAVAMTMLIISGQIDLSVGAIVAITGVISALLMVKSVPPLIAVVIALIVASFIGFLNGVISTKYNIHSMLVTLATTTVIRGFAFIITGGYPISFGSSVPAFSLIGQGHLWIIPVPVIIMIVFYLIGSFVLNNTAFGRSIYAVGGNEESARLSGINTVMVKVKVFVVSGLLAGISGLILSARLMSGVPETGNGIEMDVIAAVVMGGTSFSGGIGKLSGTILGMLLIGVISNGMVILGLSAYIQMIVKGLVILLAVMVNNSYNKG
jgi:ribose/xylose/arabinose/galactoside ABC-type transport system permease subunit